MKTLTNCVAAALVTGPLAYSAQAVLIQNLTTETVLLSSGFEGQATGQLTTSEPDVGAWPGDATGVNSQVVNAGIAGFAAYEGDQFLRLVHDGDAGTRGAFSLYSLGGTGSQVLEFNFAFRLEPGDNPATEVLRGGFQSGGTGIDLKFYADGSITHRDQLSQGGTGSEQALGSLTHNVNEWNTVVVQLVNGASTGQISINGSAFETVYMRSAGNITALYFSANTTGTTAYIDAIPEPASLALLGMGGLMMLRRRRV